MFCCGVKRSHGAMRSAVVALVFLVLCCLSGFDACGRRRSPPRDRNSPIMTCPENVITTAGYGQDSKRMFWIKPTAFDLQERRRITPSLVHGPPPGSLFSEGSHYITYSAMDRSKNVQSCSFNIQVIVIRCKAWYRLMDGWMRCSYGSDTLYGTICRFGCYTGYELIGPSWTRCGDDGSWTVASQPYCKKIQCSQLTYPAYRLDKVPIVCTDGNNYRSICTFFCKDGYSVKPGHSKVLVCGPHSTWVGTTPVCVDIKPPSFTNCPLVKSIYAEKYKSSGLAFWDDPLATDNSGSAAVTQTYGPLVGTELDAGEHDVMYTAKDSTGNIAICQFKVVVKQIRCPTIYPLPYTSVSCPNGSIFGSSCQFACDSGTSTSLPLVTQCERLGTRYYYGLWDFGNQQPYCKQSNPCPDLRAPGNGALACDIWLEGRFCQTFCQDGYAVYDNEGIELNRRLLVCGDTGVWHLSDRIQDCKREVLSRGSQSYADIKYTVYEGSCEAAKKVIQEKFILRVNSSLQCNPPECSVSTVEVTCGERVKRDTYLTLNIRATIDMSANFTYAETISRTESLNDYIKRAQRTGDLDINLTLTNQSLGVQSVDVSLPKAVCPEGSAPGSGLKCVECGPGFYHDTTVQPSVCRKCSVDFYQDESGKTYCKLCLFGTTTEDEGATKCKEACQLGYYSTKGTIPCDPCDIGYYADKRGTREQCTPCPGSKTTNKTGSTTSDMCYDFDLNFFALNETEEMELPYIEVNASSVQELSLSMWLKCTSCDDVMEFTDETGTKILNFQIGDFLQITNDSIMLANDSETLATVRWQYLHVTWSLVSVEVYLDGQLVSNDTFATDSFPTKLNVTLGGPGYFGSISQFNMYSIHSTSLHDGNAPVPNTCFTDNVGDLLSWKQFSGLDGSFVETRSRCDAFDNCASLPCQNGGNCTDAMEGFTCACVEGFTGSDCSINIDDCINNNFCSHSGTCVDAVNDFKCSCPSRFTGELCEMEIVDGEWSSFGNWSLCSVTCGTGQQVRNRTCDNPEPNNGGKDCPGDNFEIKACNMDTCINECVIDLDPLEHGDLNCTWDSDNETRLCYPACDDGYDFDSDLYVDPPNIFCGPETGHLWNIGNTLELPTCQNITKAMSNQLDFSARYADLAPTEANATLFKNISDVVTNNAKTTSCVANDTCRISSTSVELKHGTNSSESEPFVMFTVKITCKVISGINECYDLLSTVVDEMNDMISARDFTVFFDGTTYDVAFNSTSLDGDSDCEPGYVPVVQYCVACGPGMYQNGEFCDQCPVGYYQDQTAQLTCKQCPEGWTTADVQSRNSSYCKVKHLSESTFILDYIAMAIGISAIVVVIIVALLVVIHRRRKGREDSWTKRQPLTSQTLFGQRPYYNPTYQDVNDTSC